MATLEFPTFRQGGLAEQIRQKVLRSVFKGTTTNNAFYASALCLGDRLSNEMGIAKITDFERGNTSMPIITPYYKYGR
jgi:hypothetical protein